MGACVRNAVRPTIQASTRNVRRALRSRSGWMQCFHRGKGGEYKNADSTSRLPHPHHLRIKRSLLLVEVAINRPKVSCDPKQSTARGLLLSLNRCRQPQQPQGAILQHQQEAFTILRHQQEASPNECYSGCTKRLLHIIGTPTNSPYQNLRYQHQQHLTLAVGTPTNSPYQNRRYQHQQHRTLPVERYRFALL